MIREKDHNKDISQSARKKQTNDHNGKKPKFNRRRENVFTRSQSDPLIIVPRNKGKDKIEDEEDKKKKNTFNNPKMKVHDDTSIDLFDREDYEGDKPVNFKEKSVIKADLLITGEIMLDDHCSIRAKVGGDDDYNMHSTYDEILNEYKSTNTPWRDKNFPGKKATRYKDPTGRNWFIPPSKKRGPKPLIWRRITDVCDTPNLWLETGPKSSDIMQGSLGDCWFLGALATLITKKNLLKLTLPNAKKQNWKLVDDGTGKMTVVHPGVFKFKFYQFGKWIEVLIDDYLPFKKEKENELAYAKCKNPTCFWVPLFEKAYAKLYHSYAALSGGFSQEAMVDMTGGIAYTMDLPKSRISSDVQKSIWKRLMHAREHNHLMSCAVMDSSKDDSRINASSKGIIYNHAYSILDVQEVGRTGIHMHGIKLIKLKNPWGSYEWNGAFSDDSEEWEKIAVKEKKRLNIVSVDDGEFWMPLEDFLKYYGFVEISKIYNTKIFSFHKRWKFVSKYGQFSKELNQAGGSGKNAWFNNPQYRLDIEEDECLVTVGFSQKDTRAKQKKLAHINLKVLKVQENRHSRVFDAPNLIYWQSNYENRREVTAHLSLSSGRYYLIPSTYKKGTETEFLLRLFSEEKFNLRPVLKEEPTRIWFRRKWKGWVSVKVVKAIGLERVGHMHNHGAYCRLQVGRFHGHECTKVAKDKKNPVWKEEFLFPISSPKRAMIKVDVVKSHHMNVSNAVLGKVRIRVRDFKKGVGKSMSYRGSYPLHTKKGSQGTLILEIRFEKEFHFI